MSTKPQIKLNFHEMRKMTSLFSAIVNTSSNLQGKKEGKVKIPSLHKRITLEKIAHASQLTQEQLDNKTVQCTIQVGYRYRFVGYMLHHVKTFYFF